MSASTSRTFAEERRTAIMDMLEHSASVQVADIAQAFGVSTVTARGDLDALAAAGKLRRTHGGAVSLHKTLTVSVQDQRVNVNVDAKQSIARAALELVRDGDTVFVDSGTTALEFVRMLDMRTGITVITADITIADYIDESLPSVDVIMLGGELRKGHRYLFGPLTMAAIATIHADLAVICPGAFVAGRGFVTDFPQMAEIKQAAMSAASPPTSCSACCAKRAGGCRSATTARRKRFTAARSSARRRSNVRWASCSNAGSSRPTQRGSN